MRSKNWKESQTAAATIISNRNRYEGFEIPWYLVGAIHYRESSFNFSTHFHNGDPLSDRTIHVPVGRPKTGTPPFTWEDSTRDALSIVKLKPKTSWDLLEYAEHYNGLGYSNRGLVSPYVWSGTSHYTSGLYVSDGTFDPDKRDSRPGIAAILFEIFKTNKPIGPIYYGAWGEWVKDLQRFLGVSDDGIAGPITSKALYDYTHSYLAGDPNGQVVR